MKIGILNAYDVRNRGDLAIILCQMAWLQRHFPHAEFFIFSHHYRENHRAFGDASIESLLHLPPGKAVEKLLHPPIDWIWLKLGASHGKFKIFKECDFYVLSGGGYLYSSRSPLMSRNLICICQEFQEALKTGKPVFPFPQSFGPLTKELDRFFVRRLAEVLRVLTPRCPASVRLLIEWGLEQKVVAIPDVCLALRTLHPNLFKKPAGKSGLGIAPIDWSFAREHSPAAAENYLNKLTALARFYFKKTGEPVMLMTQVAVRGDDDAIVVEQLRQKIEGENVPVLVPSKELPLADYLGLFQQFRLFIGSRMHSCIFALVTHTPTLGLAYQPKFQGVFETLSLNDWFQPIDRWSTDWATSKMEEALSNANLSNSIQARVKTVEEEIHSKLDCVLQKVLSPPLS